MRALFTLAIIFSIVTLGYSDPKKPKKPKGCTKYACTDWDWKNKKGLFDPHTIQWPLHHDGETYKDKVDGGAVDIDIVFKHYGKQTRVPLREYRKDLYYGDKKFLDKGIKMNDAFVCKSHYTEEPYWQDNTCAMIAPSHEDVQVFVDGPSCSKIVRHWSVVDWCKWEPNTVVNSKTERYTLVKDIAHSKVYWSYGGNAQDIEHDGWYTFQQVIKILDKDPPEIAQCDDITYELEETCETKVKLKNKVIDSGPCPGKKMTVEIKIYKDGFVFLEKWLTAHHAEDFWANLGYMSAGHYVIHWSVKDGCGNYGGCTQNLYVIDKNPPHLICIQDLSTSINDDSGATIWASDFVHKVQGPCYDDNLTYSFYPDTVVNNRTFTCDGGIGLQEFEVYVTGSNGVQVSCNASIFVADHAKCDPTGMQIAGKVTDKFKNPINNTEVMIQADGAFINSGMSNEYGIYGVNGISFDLGRPEIVAKAYDEEPTKGLDAVDLIFLLRHIQDIQTLTKPDAKAAADVNSDGLIDMEDYWDLVDLIYDIPGREADVQAWKFYDEKVGLFAGFNHIRLVKPVKLARFRQQYGLIGLKTGDIDFSWRPTPSADNRSARLKSSAIAAESTNQEHIWHVDIPSQESVMSLSLDIASSMTGDLIERVSVDDQDLTFVLEEREGASQVIVLSTSDLGGKTLQIASKGGLDLLGTGQVYESLDEEITVMTDWLIDLDGLQDQDERFLVSPNPFDEQSIVHFRSEDYSRATIEVYSVQGSLVSRSNVAVSKGENTIPFGAEIRSSGIYVVKLSLGTEHYVRRIVKN